MRKGKIYRQLGAHGLSPNSFQLNDAPVKAVLNGYFFFYGEEVILPPDSVIAAAQPDLGKGSVVYIWTVSDPAGQFAIHFGTTIREDSPECKLFFQIAAGTGEFWRTDWSALLSDENLWNPEGSNQGFDTGDDPAYGPYQPALVFSIRGLRYYEEP